MKNVTKTVSESKEDVSVGLPADASLTSARAAETARLEAIIMAALKSCFDAGRALEVIRQEKRYLDLGYPTFEDYCQKRLGWSRQRGSQLIQAAQLVAELPPALSTRVDNEATARELRKLPAEKRTEVIQQAIDDDIPLTPKLVRTYLPPPKPKSKPQPAEPAPVVPTPSEDTVETLQAAADQLLARLEAVKEKYGQQLQSVVGPIAQWAWTSQHLFLWSAFGKIPVEKLLPFVAQDVRPQEAEFVPTSIGQGTGVSQLR